MDIDKVGVPICKSGEKPFLYLSVSVIGEQSNQETHIRPPDAKKFRRARTRIDQGSGELRICCDKLTYHFKAVGEDIECWEDKENTKMILSSESAAAIRLIEFQVEGNMRKHPPIYHKNKK
jgi:hypothetical protein